MNYESTAIKTFAQCKAARMIANGFNSVRSINRLAELVEQSWRRNGLGLEQIMDRIEA